MKYLLDTNMCVYIISKRVPNLMQKFQSLRDKDDIGISSIVVSELEYGIQKSQRKEENRLALELFLQSVTVIPYDHKAAKAYGLIREYLERTRQPIGALDTLIAAHAVSLAATLITNNEREFSRVQDLKLENWV